MISYYTTSSNSTYYALQVRSEVLPCFNRLIAFWAAEAAGRGPFPRATNTDDAIIQLVQ